MRIATPGKRARIAAFAATAVAVSPLAMGTFSAQADDVSGIQLGETKTYIVQLADDPLVAFDGGHGLSATAPKAGEKVDVDSAAADAYTDYLGAQRAEVLASVGLASSDVVTTYKTALNGFAVKMNGAEAAHMRKAPGVLQVWEDEIRTADTVQTPDYLGLSGDNGVWAEKFGGFEHAGDGVVVGVIDTGIDPLNPSFLEEDMPAAPADWAGDCDNAGDDRFAAFECNNKIIGARWYGAEFGNTVIPEEFTSARDYNGHGSHTAGTAAGNHGVALSIMGTDLGNASGMAPRAHIAVYKGLWMTAAGTGSGTTAGLVAAIDDAVEDGVDVINYSISGSSTSVVGPDEIAFLYAADAGIFVSTSAGNSGDTVGVSSVAHNAPWTMTVAASTHNRGAVKTVTLGGEHVDRYYGADRYGTAADIARHFPDEVDTAYIATGNQYADALAGSSTASNGLTPGTASSNSAAELPAAPILLTKVNSVPQATEQVLTELGVSNIVILGGEAAVSDAVEGDLGAWGSVSRVAGADRYGTAVELAKMYGDVDKVYIANGQVFPDALSGGALAGHQDAPMLLTKGDHVPNVLADYLAATSPSEVVVLGGSAAISDAVATQVGATDRLAGSDRYGTAVAISEAFGETGVETTFVASGVDYPDALSGSALAGHLGVPVQLTKPQDLPNGVAAEFERLAPLSAVILGGLAAVGSEPEAEIRAFFGSDDPTYQGVGVGEAVSGDLVNSEDIPAAGSTAADARLCLLGSVDNAAAAGKIVICTRGTNARTEKGDEVAESGGIGMVLANATDAESLSADFHAVPSIHVNATDGAAIKAYEASNDPAPATISAQSTDPVNAPEMAGFSSYGPALAGGGDLLKPDITAPGVDIAAAYHADHDNPAQPTFNQISGTSMSAPHIAGLAALMTQEFPDWSPAAMKSAMMTTARDTDDNGGPIQRGGSDATPLDFGAGEVQPAPSYNPGLVYDAGWDEWLDYACAIGQAGGCTGDEPDASDLNYPSISIGDLPGTQTVTRTVTDVTGVGGTYLVEVDEPAGISVVAPATVVVPADGSATFDITFTATTAEPEVWAFGQLRLVNGDITVESPIAIRPLALSAPAEVSGEGTSGSADYTVTPGFTGTVTTDVDGLMPSTVLPIEVTSDGASGGASPFDEVTPITVPAGTKTLRVSVYDSETDPTPVDMDLYLANSAGQVIAQSAAGGSDESVTLEVPAAGTYYIALDYWDGAAGAVVSVPTHVWTLGDTDEGNLTVTPDTFAGVIGVPQNQTITWTGLAADSRYLGAVNYLNGTETVGKILVSVTTAE